MKDVIYEVYSNEEYLECLDYLVRNGVSFGDNKYTRQAFESYADSIYYIGSIEGKLRYNITNIWLNTELIKGFKNMKETTRKYRSFAISGTKSLLKAMEEELNLSGYESKTFSFLDETNEGLRLVSNHYGTDDFSISKIITATDVGSTNNYNKQFQLPQQWDECLAFCKGQLEPELKVGDWVTIEDDTNDCTLKKQNWSRQKKGYTFKIGCIADSSFDYVGKWVNETDWDTGKGISINQVRLATKEEIEKATSITVGEYKMEIVNGKAKFGCQYITKEEVTTLRKFLGEPYHAKISMHNTEITTELLNKILDRL